MPLIIEDGSVVSGANSYATYQEIEAYADARGIELAADSEILAIQAMDYLQSLDYKGDKVSALQSLKFPRSGVDVDGFTLDSDSVPYVLKNAQCATAISIDQGVDPLAAITPGVKREKLDVLEVEYQDGASSQSINRTINALLRPLLAAGGAFRVSPGR